MPAPHRPSPILRPDLPALFAPRPADSHKGTFGTVAVIGSGPGMTGAALLSARAELKTGAGKVLVGFAQETAPLPYDPLQPEMMLREAAGLHTAGLPVDAWVAGCDLGIGAAGLAALSAVFEQRGDA